jgi:hypothetical protein
MYRKMELLHGGEMGLEKGLDLKKQGTHTFEDLPPITGKRPCYWHNPSETLLHQSASAHPRSVLGEKSVILTTKTGPGMTQKLVRAPFQAPPGLGPLVRTTGRNHL